MPNLAHWGSGIGRDISLVLRKYGCEDVIVETCDWLKFVLPGEEKGKFNIEPLPLHLSRRHGGADLLLGPGRNIGWKIVEHR